MVTQIREWFFDILSNDNQCVLYGGFFSDDITDRVIQLNEYNIDRQDEEKKIKKRVTFLLAECFQNVIRHGENSVLNNEFDPSRGFFMSRNTAGLYVVVSGNLIENEFVEKLKEQLEEVNRLEPDELKDLYRKVITEGEMSSKGGAGLGLIDMARKSGQKLTYQFNNYNEKYALFYNQITLKSEKMETATKSPSFKLEGAIEMHRRMVEGKIIMLQKGDFSKDSIFPVLKIMENNVMRTGKDSASIKEMFHVMVELLQNISRHGYRNQNVTEGIFILARKNDKYVISAANNVENAHVPEFERLLQRINKMDENELTTEYLHLLKSGNETENGGAGIGLIDIARLVSVPFDYEFYKVDEDITFFSITMTI